MAKTQVLGSGREAPTQFPHGDLKPVTMIPPRARWIIPVSRRLEKWDARNLRPGMLIVTDNSQSQHLLVWASLSQEGGFGAVYLVVPLREESAGLDANSQAGIQSLTRAPGVYAFISEQVIAEQIASGALPNNLQVIKLLSVPGGDAKVLAHVKARMDRERQALESMAGHPSFPQIYGFGNAPIPFIRMEYLRGITLAKLIENPELARYCGHEARQGKLPWQFLFRCFIQLVEAVTHLHTVVQILHRDLKPENILVVPSAKPGEFTVKLIDFGLAKEVDAIGTNAELTRAQGACFSLEFAGPEFLDQEEPDAAYDVFALGRIFCAACEGRDALEYLVQGENLREALENFRARVRDPLPDCTHPDLPELGQTLTARLWRNMTAVEPSRRPSLDEVSRRITRVNEAYVLANRRK